MGCNKTIFIRHKTRQTEFVNQLESSVHKYNSFELLLPPAADWFPQRLCLFRRFWDVSLDFKGLRFREDLVPHHTQFTHVHIQGFFKNSELLLEDLVLLLQLFKHLCRLFPLPILQLLQLFSQPLFLKVLFCFNCFSISFFCFSACSFSLLSL